MARMSENEIEALLVVLAQGGSVECVELGYLLSRSKRAISRGDAYEAGRRRAAPLLAGGALDRPQAGRYVMTEKGRIAAALALSRRPDLRSAFPVEPDEGEAGRGGR